MTTESNKALHIWKGLVYVKHGRIGSRSEGPDYYLQTTSGDYLLHLENRVLWQPDYQLEFYGRRMVEVQGILQSSRLIEVKSIRAIEESLLPSKQDSDVPSLGEAVRVQVGKSIRFDEGAELAFQEVVEDSRCPPGVLCVWEGRAVVSLRLTAKNSASDNFSLSLHAGHPDLAESVILGYKLTLLSLEPESQSTGADAKVDYVATLLITTKQEE